jgi:hypothetical protein
MADEPVDRQPERLQQRHHLLPVHPRRQPAAARVGNLVSKGGRVRRSGIVALG